MPFEFLTKQKLHSTGQGAKNPLDHQRPEKFGSRMALSAVGCAKCIVSPIRLYLPATGPSARRLCRSINSQRRLLSEVKFEKPANPVALWMGWRRQWWHDMLPKYKLEQEVLWELGAIGAQPNK